MSDKAPKISPLSMSVWQDPDNRHAWHWTVQRGEKVIEKGTNINPDKACRQATTALGTAKSSPLPKPERLGVQ